MKKTMPMHNFGKCELCGRWSARHKHNFMSGRNRQLKPGQRNEIGAKQRIINLCAACHNDVHSLTAEKFHLKYAVSKSNYLYTSKRLDINGLPIMSIGGN